MTVMGTPYQWGHREHKEAGHSRGEVNLAAATHLVEMLEAAGVQAQLEWYFKGQQVQPDSIVRHHYAMFDVCALG